VSDRGLEPLEKAKKGNLIVGNPVVANWKQVGEDLEGLSEGSVEHG
jgi:hypothetical protein